MLKKLIDLKRARFYLLTGCAYLLLWLVVDLTLHTEKFHLWALNEIWRALYVVPVIYIFFEFTLPQLSRKRIVRSTFLLALQILFFSFGMYAWREIGIIIYIHTPFTSYTTCGEGVGEQFGASLFAVLFFGIIKHIYNYFILKQSAQRLQIEKQEAELNYLKSQTNPHFLFNTLNNIYSLARDKSDLAPESILRLSKILRFMLYETNGTYIALEKEIKIISDYIELEKLRYDDSLNVNFNYNIEDMKQSLPPLLLIPLVENAFKHGVSETRNMPFVDIHLEVKNRHLTFIVKNSVERIGTEDEIKENIGLTNLRRQLELLYREYDLSLKHENSYFTALLKINLLSHV